MYVNKPTSAWPPLKVNWAYDSAKWIYSFDGKFPDWVQPDKLRLGRAPIAEIHKHLVFNSKIHNLKEFWDGASEDKAEEVIRGWSVAESMSPPVLMSWPKGNCYEINLAGGNHRFNIAKLVGEINIPFLAIESHKEILTGLLPSVEWL